MRATNQTIQHVRHLMPTVEDVNFQLNEATIVQSLDLREAYHQLVLHSNNRHITTFVTHERLFRFKRLNYGSNTAGELFQHVLQEKLSGIKGVVHGKTHAVYDEALDCLKRFQQVNLKLKPEKCQFLQESI